MKGSCLFNLRTFIYLQNILLSVLLFGAGNLDAVNWNQKEWHHAGKLLDDGKLYSVTDTKTNHYQSFNETLDKILIVRVPGTPGHRLVNRYIVQSMKDLNWHVEEDVFMADTPLDSRPFRNIIATLDPKACKRIIIASHYDSLYTSTNQFVGAIDSAVPAAMMLHIAQTLNVELQKNLGDTTLQFIFFDGEEALKDWNENDSLYGARHLAAKWDKTPFPRDSEEKKCKGDYVSELDRIEVLVLLDLIGDANPTFYSYFSETGPLHSRLRKIEKKLNNLKIIEAHPSQSKTSYFQNRESTSYIEDDHIPFLRKGVPILHIIPNPFPPVWHRENDDRAHLHHPTIINLIKIFKVFICEYLHLNVEGTIR